MIKPQLRPTADQTFEIVADPADRNWDFVGILARSRREEQQGNIEAACNTRYHAVQRLEELIPESGEVILECLCQQNEPFHQLLLSLRVRGIFYKNYINISRELRGRSRRTTLRYLLARSWG